MTRPANRLANETSPYLLQHAHNPVDWYPWGEEALSRAHAEDKPILLSVGYAACHWCHVMERESFEDAAIAAQMNRDFICIKVDREERPDIDALYMTAVQTLTGQGGWPMTVFLAPDGKPFYGGTYFPPDDRYGRPGFPRVLQAVAEAWSQRRLEVLEQGEELCQHLHRSHDLAAHLQDTLLTPAILDTAFQHLSSQFDYRHGGFGDAPKFPQPANLDLLLRYHQRSHRQEPLAMVEKTLQRMALGGLYDQLGGGFHRYSTDQVWLAPHFEKMSYDNAQLARTYAHAYQLTGRDFYRGVAEETLDYILREMTSPQGGFYSAQDADSEGEEGKFFVWTPAEVVAILGEADAALFNAFYDVQEGGNWEGKSILRVVQDANDLAKMFGIPLEEAATRVDTARETLFHAREKRIKPLCDDKILTAWNGLLLSAFAECAPLFGRPDFLQAAQNNAQFLLAHHATTDSEGYLRLLRTSRGGEARLNGYLEDYAFFAEGLILLYEATFDRTYLDTAHALAKTMLARFWDDANGGFFATSDDHETLIQRLKDWDDNATPSGNSVALEVLLRLAVFFGEDDYTQRVARVLRRLGTVVRDHPYSFARLAAAVDWYLDTPKEIAILGDPSDPATAALLQTVYALSLPNRVLVHAADPATAPADIPLLAQRSLVEGKPTAYVCARFVCEAPVTTPDALRKQLTSSP